MKSRDVDHFIQTGLGWIVRHFPDWAREGRMRCGTNDILLICFAESGADKVRVYFRKRTEASILLGIHMPEYIATKALIDAPKPPQHIPVLIFHKGEVYTLVYPLRASESAVLN
jgi:hypothetical protein